MGENEGQVARLLTVAVLYKAFSISPIAKQLPADISEIPSRY